MAGTELGAHGFTGSLCVGGGAEGFLAGHCGDERLADDGVGRRAGDEVAIAALYLDDLAMECFLPPLARKQASSGKGQDACLHHPNK